MLQIRSIRLGFAAVLMLLALCTPLRAQQTDVGRDGTGLEGYAGVYLPGSIDFQQGENGFEVEDSRVTFGARLGYTFAFNLFLEASAGYVPLRYETADGLRNLNAFIFTGVLGYNFQPLPTLQLFLLAGGGVTQWNAAGLSAENDLEAVLGGGVRVFLTPGLSLGAQVRDHIIPETLSDLRESLNPGMEIDGALTHNLEISASVSLFFGVNRDADEDRVFDRYDTCPDTPSGARSDAYGCPLDGDADGVPDYRDRCPSTPPGIAVNDAGCPLDSDGDGLTDDIDRCPATPANLAVDQDGCPLDGDGDGVFTGIDRCPNTPAGAVVDETGCSLDSDGDGVADGLDSCPNTPEGREVDEAGCSLIQAGLEEGRLVLSSIYFETSSASLLGDSRQVLNEVGQALLDRPGIRIEIQGYTDSTGPAAFNVQLSERRALAVLEYLTTMFPALDRAAFVVQGYGPSRPIASNQSAEGRSLNRRVEFLVLDSE